MNIRSVLLAIVLLLGPCLWGVCAQQEVRGIVFSPMIYDGPTDYAYYKGSNYNGRFGWTIINKNSFSVYVDIEIVGSKEGVVYTESLVLDSEKAYELKPDKCKWSEIWHWVQIDGERKLRRKENTYTLTYRAYKLE